MIKLSIYEIHCKHVIHNQCQQFTISQQPCAYTKQGIHDQNNFIAGAWCAEHTESVTNNQEQYVQIDLKLPIKIAKVGTQGQASLISNNWVTFFKFNHSEDGRTWKQYNQVSVMHGK
jgi:hypothetical protein